jgi:hypothetical protein
MRTIPQNLAAHLADGATNLCHCWKLTRRDAVRDPSKALAYLRV